MEKLNRFLFQIAGLLTVPGQLGSVHLRSAPNHQRKFPGKPAIIHTHDGSGSSTNTYQVSPNDWPQVGHDPQRTNASSIEVDPSYCYTWKWYGAPIASRVQPVVSNGILFIGGLMKSPLCWPGSYRCSLMELHQWWTDPQF